MKNLLFVAVVSSVALAGCNMAHQQYGAVGGGIAGGLLGNTVGSGSGKTAATVLGTMLGTMAGAEIGKSMDAQRTIVYANHTDVCSGYTNEGAKSSCQRGAADRAKMNQMNLERSAYSRGYRR